jgi:phosphoribosylglycinamide formyltransferase-1
MTAPLPIGVLASGEGTNLQALLDTVHGREAEVVGVASDRPGARALERAAAAGVPAELFPLDAHPDRPARDAAIADWLQERGARLVVLAGWMALLTPGFLARFPGAVLNVHPSLLPAFPGIAAVDQAVAYGVRVFGVTVHFVDEGIDTGPIVLQGSVELRDAPDAAAVRARLRPVEHALLPEAVRLVARGALRSDPANPRRILIEDGPAGPA